MVSKANFRLKFTCRSDAHTQTSRSYYKLCLLGLDSEKNHNTHTPCTCTQSVRNPNRRGLYFITSHTKS